MVIRDYRPGDFPRIIRLWKLTGVFADFRGDTSDTIDQCNRQGGKFLVMEESEGGTLWGTSWMTWDGRRIHLHHFAILPEQQGKGLGRLLALESLQFAKKKGCPVKLEVHGENVRAIGLYTRLGFKVMQNYGVYILLETGLEDPGHRT